MVLEMNHRKKMIRTDKLLRHGEEDVPRRSQFTEWNYGAELFAFGCRLGEKFDDSLLREAFTTEGYARAEARRQRELGVQFAEPPNTNLRLAEKGEKLLERALLGYVRAAFPYLPEEGVQAFVDFLRREETLADVSYHIGTKDLILSEEYPPTKSTHQQVLRALVGALAEGSGEERAARFVVDLVAAQLHVQDINELWEIADPMAALARVLANDGRGEPESRLLWAAGKDTLMACFHIGVYSDKELVGQAPGETVEIAEEMAARDALRRIFRTDEARPMLPMGDQALSELDLRPDTPNQKLSEWSEGGVGNLVVLEGN